MAYGVHKRPLSSHTSLSHGGNTGSNPVGDAKFCFFNKINNLQAAQLRQMYSGDVQQMYWVRPQPDAYTLARWRVDLAADPLPRRQAGARGGLGTFIPLVIGRSRQHGWWRDAGRKHLTESALVRLGRPHIRLDRLKDIQQGDIHVFEEDVDLYNFQVFLIYCEAVWGRM
jgi:hypothetical protein